MLKLMKPLDRHFNIAVLQMASRLFPTGFAVSDDAPGSYEELCQHLDAGKRMVVWSGGSDATIFADPEVNYAFRAWHDWTHWRHRLDFTLAGEAYTAAQQTRDLRKVFGDWDDHPDRLHWADIIRVEVYEQAKHHAMCGDFVDDQVGFALMNLPAHVLDKLQPAIEHV